MRQQRVELGERSYSIYIERGLSNRVACHVQENFHPTSVCIVTDSNLAGLYLSGLEDSFQQTGIPVCSFVIEAGEASKNITTLSQICAFLLDHKFDRNGMLVALGGGVVGDLTGFAASIFKRGIPFVQIPTSVVAQTDSSIGGKTGIDFGGAKNMLGTIYQPVAVYVDPDLLRTLPACYLSDGLGEVVKYALLSGGELYARIMRLDKPSDFLEDDGFILDACIAYKRKLVEQDEHDNGLRMLLNLGHTFGHAIESYYAYRRYSHGEAVAIGLVEILSYAVAYHGLNPEVVQDVRAVLQALSLPMEVDGNRQEILRKILQDKKCLGSTIRIALPYAPGDVRVVPVSTEVFIEQIVNIKSFGGQ